MGRLSRVTDAASTAVGQASSAVSTAVKQAKKEIKRTPSNVKDLLSSPGAAATATTEAVSAATDAAAAEAERQRQLNISNRQSPLRRRGRQSTILAGRNPQLVESFSSPRKTLLGG